MCINSLPDRVGCEKVERGRICVNAERQTERWSFRALKMVPISLKHMKKKKGNKTGTGRRLGFRYSMIYMSVKSKEHIHKDHVSYTFQGTAAPLM